MTTRTPEELEEKLHYHFKNKELLITALTHSSYANESKTPTLYNERLEFLGDSVLSVVVANYLFHHSTRPEGELSRMRASLVSEDALFQFAQEIDLGSYLRLGRGEELGGGRERASILADATESVFAAVYLDGGMEAASALIHRVLLDKEREEVVEERRRDYKTQLQELVQRKSGSTLSYEMIGATGPDHAKIFEAAVLLNGEPLSAGTGRSKKEAEQTAARAALEKLAEQN